MATGLIHYTWCLIILTSCFDRGDGRWKRKDKENLQKDIELFRNMADKIEDEIDAFYEEYPDEILTGDVSGIRYRHTGRTLDNAKGSEVEHHVVKQDVLSILNNETNEIQSRPGTGLAPDVSNVNRKLEEANSNKDTNNLNLAVNTKSSWPNFDDILLEMGKRYDWKNDRWIKVKRKFKYSRDSKMTAHNNLDFHLKHKFYYRIVKLNKSKNRRNVVVAVSAVR